MKLHSLLVLLLLGAAVCVPATDAMEQAGDNDDVDGGDNDDGGGGDGGGGGTGGGGLKAPLFDDLVGFATLVKTMQPPLDLVGYQGTLRQVMTSGLAAALKKMAGAKAPDNFRFQHDVVLKVDGKTHKVWQPSKSKDVPAGWARLEQALGLQKGALFDGTKAVAGATDALAPWQKAVYACMQQEFVFTVQPSFLHALSAGGNEVKGDAGFDSLTITVSGADHSKIRVVMKERLDFYNYNDYEAVKTKSTEKLQVGPQATFHISCDLTIDLTKASKDTLDQLINVKKYSVPQISDNGKKAFKWRATKEFKKEATQLWQGNAAQSVFAWIKLAMKTPN